MVKETIQQNWNAIPKVAKNLTAIGAAIVMLFAVYGHFAKTSEVVAIAGGVSKNKIEIDLFQIRGDINYYRRICGARLDKCPTPEDQARVDRLLDDKRRLEKQREHLMRQ